MRRTIIIDSDSTRYKDTKFKDIILSVLDHFGALEKGKYVVAITESSKGRYRFIPYLSSVWHIIEISKVEEEKEEFSLRAGSIGGVCSHAFNKIFFEPDGNKTYNITVKKIKV